MKRALITGITGQDGPYLAEHLVSQDWEVFGMVRGQPTAKWDEVHQLVPALRLLSGDLLDQSSLQEVLSESVPDAVFNLGSLSFVPASFRQPALAAEITGLGALRMLEAIRTVNPEIAFVQASSSEMYGNARVFPQDEDTEFCPASPYATAKVFAYNTVVNYRNAYGLNASNAIMFNHESPRRGIEFVTRKISLAVARIKAGRQDHLTLGRTDTRRDWGWAPEYMAVLPDLAMRRQPEDLVFATGESHTVQEFLEEAFAQAGLDWTDHLRRDVSFCRPEDVSALEGNPARALSVLGWKAEVRFQEIVRRMVVHDLEAEGVPC